jgi:hypothetical protein
MFLIADPPTPVSRVPHNCPANDGGTKAAALGLKTGAAIACCGTKAGAATLIAGVLVTDAGAPLVLPVVD